MNKKEVMNDELIDSLKRIRESMLEEAKRYEDRSSGFQIACSLAVKVVSNAIGSEIIRLGKK